MIPRPLLIAGAVVMLTACTSPSKNADPAKGTHIPATSADPPKGTVSPESPTPPKKPAPVRKPAFIPEFTGPDRLVTNEFAHWNPGVAGTRRSRDWEVTSGSLYVRSGVGWSGPPDTSSPDRASSRGTGSSVFRMNSRRADFGDVLVTLRFRILRMLERGGHGDAAATDGVHVMLRRQDPTELYVASLNRRDESLVVKKKLRGGTENGGTYVTLGQVPYRPRIGRWQSFDVRISSAPISTDGSRPVTVTVGQDGHRLLRVVDDGAHGPPILRPGSVGIRGDNCEFEFTDFEARPLH